MALTDNIVGYWKFDEGTGSTVADATGNGLTGTLVNSPSWVPGIINDGVQFASASTQYMNVISTTTFNGGSVISLNGWFKGSAAESFVRLQPGDYVILSWQAASALRSAIMSNDGGAFGGLGWPDTINDGNWHMLTSTWEQNTTNGFKIYLDGSLYAQRDSVNSPLGALGAGNWIFFSYEGVTELMNGTADEIGIWKRALTSTEVSQLYNSGAGLQYPFTPSSPTNHTLTLVGQGT